MRWAHGTWVEWRSRDKDWSRGVTKWEQPVLIVEEGHVHSLLLPCPSRFLAELEHSELEHSELEHSELEHSELGHLDGTGHHGEVWLVTAQELSERHRVNLRNPEGGDMCL